MGRLPLREYFDVLHELMRREVEEQMRNEHAAAVLAGLGVKYKTEPPALAAYAVRDHLAGAVGARGRKPTGAAAAAAQAAWDTL